MSFLRPLVHRTTSAARTTKTCRNYSLDSSIYKGLNQESRGAGGRFGRQREGRVAYEDAYRSADQSRYGNDRDSEPRQSRYSNNRDSESRENRYNDRDFEPRQNRYGNDKASVDYKPPELPFRHIDPYNKDPNNADWVRKPARELPRLKQDSEFLYGTNVVEAALKSGRRHMYRLYIYAGENRTKDSKIRDMKLKNMSRMHGVDVQETQDLGLLDAMSNSRPHNGYVLEASPILKIPILALGKMNFDKTRFSIQKAQHDITNSGIRINDLPSDMPNRNPGHYPILLMLDEILDPGNLGAILRTAYFLGVSALIVAEKNCAPLSPTCLKASAGAAEFLPILTQMIPQRMITNSQANGWQFFAAMPPPYKKSNKHVALDAQIVREASKTAPTVIVMGGEGEGLRSTIVRECDKLVYIKAAEDVERGIDSLNVSVAAGILIQGFMPAWKA
ncbi:Alpha/beta knot methyltransferase [Pyronema omphalodes]|nr:Alpha/beta knot methyltransferase [Pyronema omphalodes]